MSFKPEIGLVTVLYNGEEMLPDFFTSLANQSYKNFKLYLIDNSQESEVLEKSIELANKYKIEHGFIDNSENYGVAKGNNQGIEQALNDGCEYILLLNYDISFSEDTISNMISYAKAESEKIMVPKIYYAGTNIIWMAGGSIFEHQGINSHRGINKEDEGQFDEIEHTEYAPTCFMLIHKSVFSEVGMMDENYFVYFDDTDFVYRALQKKFKICYFPNSAVNHKVSASTGGKESTFSVYYLIRNRIYFVYKNFRGMNRIRSFLFIAKNRFKWYRTATREQKKSFRRGLKDIPKMINAYRKSRKNKHDSPS